MDETKSTNLLTKRVIVGIDQTTVQHKRLPFNQAEQDYIAPRSSSCISVQRNISALL